MNKYISFLLMPIMGFGIKSNDVSCMDYISNNSNILQQDNNITIDVNEEDNIEQNNIVLQDYVINGIDDNLILSKI